jgi:hypothetical protein
MPTVQALQGYHPRARWFLNAVLHLPEVDADDLERFDKRLPRPLDFHCFWMRRSARPL